MIEDIIDFLIYIFLIILMILGILIVIGLCVGVIFLVLKMIGL